MADKGRSGAVVTLSTTDTYLKRLSQCVEIVFRSCARRRMDGDRLRCAELTTPPAEHVSPDRGAAAVAAAAAAVAAAAAAAVVVVLRNEHATHIGTAVGAAFHSPQSPSPPGPPPEL